MFFSQILECLQILQNISRPYTVNFFKYFSINRGFIHSNEKVVRGSFELGILLARKIFAMNQGSFSKTFQIFNDNKKT